jgi:predicted nucleic acid-binding protein
VKAFLDTSVLVAAFYGDHQHHAPSIELFLRQKKTTGCTAAHCLAEIYAAVTGMPGRARASPHEALLFLGDVRERLALVVLDEAEYVATLESAATAGIFGGAVYDALIARCAQKVRAEVLYTWNAQHFGRFGAQIAARVRQP